jgi:hypothetical protein
LRAKFGSTEPARTRLVQDWEFAECLAIDSGCKVGRVRAMPAYMRI